jgi:hypothetical protein
MSQFPGKSTSCMTPNSQAKKVQISRTISRLSHRSQLSTFRIMNKKLLIHTKNPLELQNCNRFQTTTTNQAG